MAEYADEERALQNAVARIVPGAIQSRLPKVAFRQGEEIHLGRRYYRKPQRPVELLPQFLLTINWADSGPGISWPESYHVAYLPRFDRYVVTASRDSTDLWGYTELAIGWFPADEDLASGAHKVVTGWWRMQHEGWEQGRWAYVWDEGVVFGTDAETWADEVWGEEVWDEDVDDTDVTVLTEREGGTHTE